MSATAVLVLLLCCWPLSLADDAAALNENVALAEGDAAVKDDVATLLVKMNTLERRVVKNTVEQDHLKTRLLRQESLNQELRTMLLQQNRLIQLLSSAAVSQASTTVSHDDIKEVTDSGTPESGSDSAVSGHNVAQRSDSGRNVTMRSDVAHKVAKRSDDGGPLEAVVNQISQRVTEQGAELQALRAQTTADLNALKVQTTADLNALKVQTAADVQTLQNSDRQQSLAIQDARTSTYVRWGSSTCNDSSSLVYSGRVGGSLWSDSGAATNHLCLTPSPVFSGLALPNNYANLYGAQYNRRYSFQDKTAVCAVCRAAFSTTVMVPGTASCSSGWHRQYWGYLMAGSHEHLSGTEYICVDAALESVPHGDADLDGAQLDYTVTRCGSLPCGPYVNNKIVMCAVCSM